MGKLSSYRRIITQDFKKEEAEFVEQIASPINDSFNELYFAVNGRLSIQDNLFCTVKLIDVTVNASGIPTTSTTFTTTKPAPVTGITVILAQNQVNTAIYPTGQPFISYTAISGGILINHISGLQANQRYTIRLIAWH